MPVHCRVIPALNLAVPIHTPGWREALLEYSALPKITTQCFQPGLEHVMLDPEAHAPTMRPPCLHRQVKRDLKISSKVTCLQFYSYSQREKVIYSEGSVVKWFRALDLKSGDPWFKSSTLLLSGFVLGSPKLNSSTALCK